MTLLNDLPCNKGDIVNNVLLKEILGDDDDTMIVNKLNEENEMGISAI